MIDRRELLERVAVLLGGAVSSSAAAGVLAGLVATPAAAQTTPRFFTAAEARTVAAMAEQIIPRTDTPGAIDAGVPAFIDRMMADFYQDRDRQALRAGLTRVDADSRTAHGRAFADLTAAEQIALMKVYDAEAYRPAPGQRHFFRTMKELTTLGFFSSEPGATKVLNYAPNPGPFRGDVPLSAASRTSAL